MIAKKLIPAKDDGKSCFHRAGNILVDPDTVIDNGCVEVCNGIIQGVHSAPPDVPEGDLIDHGPGVLMPPLVNSHLHLELSALKGCLSFDKGFRSWVQQLIEKRDGLSRSQMMLAAKNAAKKMRQEGVLWVGDIASLYVVRPQVPDLSLNGIFFQEFLGVSLPEVSPEIQNVRQKNFAFGLSGHAPHTTSPDLLRCLKQKSDSAGLVFSIHLAESDDEHEFIRDQKGKWADFLVSRGIDFETWQIREKTPVAHAWDIGILDGSTLAVHLLNLSSTDLELIVKTGTRVCVCPRSNLNLHNRLPDIQAMVNKGIAPALGTDSLASCESLDIFDEMAFVGHHYPNIPPEAILAMGTVNGAAALGVEKKTGTLEKGKRGDLLYVAVSAQTKHTLIERIISNEA